MKNNDTAQHYLANIDRVGFLSKKQQIEIGLEIKKNELLIIETCIVFKDFKNQLLQLNENLQRSPDNIIKYSKLLDDGSSVKQKKKILNFFNELFLLLKTDDTTNCLRFLNEIKLSSSTLNQLLAPIKKKYRDVSDKQDQLKRIYSFFEIESYKDFIEISEKFSNQEYRDVLCKNLLTTESKIVKYMNDGLDIFSWFNKENIEDIDKLKELHKKITFLEAKVEKQRNILIESNLPLVVSRAKKHLNKGLDFEDLIQEGNIGLIKAVDKFEPERKIKLTTYATWWIDQAIRRSIANKSKTIRIPVHIQDVIQRINKSFYLLLQELGRNPTNKEISEHADIPLKSIEELAQTMQHEIGIDEEISNGMSVSDLVVDDSSNSPYINTSRTILREKIRSILSDLSPRNEKIIRLRYGIGSDSPKTLEEIGNRLGVTRERIRQLERKSISNIKNNCKVLDLKNKLD